MSENKNKSLEELLAELRAQTDVDNPRVVREEKLEPPKPSIENVVEEPIKAPEPKKEKKQKAPKAKKEKVNKKFLPKLNVSKKAKKIIVGIIAVILVIVIAILSINYALTAYLRPYQKKYNVEFPRGIAEEFCDAYGRNQAVVGSISAGDKSNFLYQFIFPGETHEERDTNMQSDDQLKAISIMDDKWDLEKNYASVEAYVKADQKFVYTDIFGKTKTYKVIAAYYTNTLPADDDGYAFPYDASGNLTDKSFDGFEDKIKSRSLYDTGNDFSYFSKYLTISTDTDFMPNYKFCVVCVEVKEKDFEKTQKATPNDKIHYPQSWYDKNEEHNPYWLAGKWAPEFEE